MPRVSGRMLAVLITLAVLFAGNSVIRAQDEAKEENKYVGNNAKVCKMCHAEQTAAWEKWPMSKSWDRLSDEEKLNPDCFRCHVTGYGEPGGFVSEKDTPSLVGVTCEACHGPAGDHMKAPMKDVEARRASVAKPAEDICLKCHVKEGNPNYVEFVYKDAAAKLADHLNKAADAEEPAEADEAEEEEEEKTDD